MEVRINGQWGSICSRYWDRLNTGVLRGSQGISDGDVVKVPSDVGPAWSSNLRCTGTESELNDCVHRLSLIHI